MGDDHTTTFRAYASARRGELRRTAYLLCGDWYLADDLVQDALAKLYVHWRRVRARSEVDAYVRRMLVNGFLATKRRAWRREVSSATLPDTPVPTADPDHGTRDMLRRALATLQPSQRTIVVLRYWDDLSVEQTARRSWAAAPATSRVRPPVAWPTSARRSRPPSRPKEDSDEHRPHGEHR